VKPEDRGTPLIGRIRASGKAEPDEDWQEEWGRHIPQRFGKGHDIYGLELDATGQSVVLRNIPVWEFREGMAAVYCWNGWEAEGWFGRVYLQADKARVVTAMEHLAKVLDLTDGMIRKTLAISATKMRDDDWRALNRRGAESLTQANWTSGVPKQPGRL
jgi:hypothetical protein